MIKCRSCNFDFDEQDDFDKERTQCLECIAEENSTETLENLAIEAGLSSEEV